MGMTFLTFNKRDHVLIMEFDVLSFGEIWMTIMMVKTYTIVIQQLAYYK